MATADLAEDSQDVGVGNTPQEAVKGVWFTEPDAALAAAEKVERPVLAVAMDHG